MYRRAAIAGTLVALVLVVLFGPAAYATVTAQPFYVDCGRLKPPGVTNLTHHGAGGEVISPDHLGGGQNPGSRTRTHPTIPQSGPLCGDYTFGKWWPPLELWATLHQPFC